MPHKVYGGMTLKGALALSDGDTGDLTPTAPFAGALRFVKVGSLVFMFGYVDRDTDFGTAGFVNVGVTLAATYRPSADIVLPSVNAYNSTQQYRYRVLGTGEVQLQRTGIITTQMGVSAFWAAAVA
jgi:hypothetical protein